MDAEVGTNGGTRKRRLAVGRIDPDKQEQVINLDDIKARIPELVRLYKITQESGDDLSEAIKNIAEDTGILAATLRKFVAAAAGEKFEEKKRQCEQLSLLFENIEA